MEVTDSPTMKAEMLSTFRAQMKQTQGIHFSKYLRCDVLLLYVHSFFTGRSLDLSDRCQRCKKPLFMYETRKLLLP